MDDNEKCQLFNMVNDSGQRHKLIEQYPVKANELLKLLNKLKEDQTWSAPHFNQ